MEELLDKIATCVEVGKINLKTPFPPAMKGLPGAEELTLQALEAGIAPADILTHGLIVGMERIGVKFKNNQVFVPQVLMSAKAMGTAIKHLKPYFSDGTVAVKGQFIIGTVEGDLPSSLAISLHDALRSSILWTVSRSCLVSLP